jgi:hypothetical protein
MKTHDLTLGFQRLYLPLMLVSTYMALQLLDNAQGIPNKL